MRIRLFGPVLGTVPMALLGAISWLSLRIGDGRTSGRTPGKLLNSALFFFSSP